MASGDVVSLTPREREILALIARGDDSRQIALSLGIAYFTVRKHRSNMLGKLGLSSAAQLAAYAAAHAPDPGRDRRLPQTGPVSVRASNRLPSMWHAA